MFVRAFEKISFSIQKENVKYKNGVDSEKCENCLLCKTSKS